MLEKVQGVLTVEEVIQGVLTVKEVVQGVRKVEEGVLKLYAQCRRVQ